MIWVRNLLEQLDEASYAGNIGMMELVKFHSKASPKDKSMLQSHIKNKKHKEAWKKYDPPEQSFKVSIDKPPKSGNMSC